MSLESLAATNQIFYEGTMFTKAHEHAMERAGTGGFGCDGHCKGTGNQEKWQCTVCKGRYTVCGKCMSEKHRLVSLQKPEEAPIAPIDGLAAANQIFYDGSEGVKAHEHPMERAGTGGFGCDGHCKGSGNQEKWQCTVCKGRYTVCGKCMAQKHHLVPIVVAAPAASTPALDALAATNQIFYEGTMFTKAHEHPMERAGTGGFGCDGHCKGTGNQEKWQCTVCKGRYTVCGTCMSEKHRLVSLTAPPPSEPTQPQAPAGPTLESHAANNDIFYEGTMFTKAHEHAMERAGTGGFGCDGHCSGTGNQEKWQCTVCKGRYTVCGKCMSEKHRLVPRVAATPAPVAASAPAATPVAAAPAPSSGITAAELEVLSQSNDVYYTGHGAVRAHDHTMVRQGYGGFGCDGHCAGSGTQERWQCTLCGGAYTVCGQCMAQAHRLAERAVAVSPFAAYIAAQASGSSGSVAHAAVAPNAPGVAGPRAGFFSLHMDSDPLHLLKTTSINFAYKCNVCNGEDNRLFTCSTCGYKTCGRCWDQYSVDPATKPELARQRCQKFPDFAMWCPMVLKPDGGNWWSCDGCSIKGSQAEAHYRCGNGHDYDLCNWCYSGQARVALAEPVYDLANPALPCRDLKDARSGNLWGRQSPFAGKIVFAKKTIEQTLDGELASVFGVGDEIHARAVWPTAIRNMALGHEAGQPEKPIYGPPALPRFSRSFHDLELVFTASVDGNPVQDPVMDEFLKTPGFVAWSRGNGSPEANTDKAREMYLKYDDPPAHVTDFWAYSQSCRVPIIQPNLGWGCNQWDGMGAALKAALARAGPGQHTVEIQLKYRLTVDKESLEWSQSAQQIPPYSRVIPAQTTPFSHPIASGTFTFESSDNVWPSLLPQRKNCSIADEEATRLEALISAYLTQSREWGARNPKTEVLMGLALTGNWSKLEKQHGCYKCQQNVASCSKWQAEPWRYAVEFEAAFYRGPLKGWEKELPCAIFKLDIVSYSKAPQNVGDILGTLVTSGVHHFSPDWLSPETWAALEQKGVKRTPADLRNGL